MAWGGKTSATQLTTVSTEQFFDQTPTSNPGESFHVQVIVNSSGTTDNAVVALYGTLDDATENWDTVPVFEIEVDATSGNDEDVSFTVPPSIYKWRIGVRRTGTTDTFTADMSFRRDNVNL